MRERLTCWAGEKKKKQKITGNLNSEDHERRLLRAQGCWLSPTPPGPATAPTV